MRQNCSCQARSDDVLGFRQQNKHILCQPLELAAGTASATLPDKNLLQTPPGKTGQLQQKNSGVGKNEVVG
ncbi:MAG: hypothetical protein FP813_01140 [Desulfurivibrio sp.]|nr:hypothetical protein [Desulfurivibrio sp.]MBU4034663.1 hypothetical protein [Pseudomonadota bacterium]MBU4119086.1 hypothetical protein [Pseudomonadota bacterium]